MFVCSLFDCFSKRKGLTKAWLASSENCTISNCFKQLFSLQTYSSLPPSPETPHNAPTAPLSSLHLRPRPHCPPRCCCGGQVYPRGPHGPRAAGRRLATRLPQAHRLPAAGWALDGPGLKSGVLRKRLVREAVMRRLQREDAGAVS